MAPSTTRLGTGTLTLGSGPLDVSAQVKSITVFCEVDQDDPVYVLSGDLVQDPAIYTWKVRGTVLLDPGTGGIGELCEDNAGTSTAFSLTTNTTGGVTVAGNVYPQPLDIGADEYGNLLESDFEWTFVAKPTITWAV